MKSVNLRIFRRTKDNISFLFNDQTVDGFNLEDLKIYNMEDKERKNPLLNVKAVDSKTATVQVVVDHTRNNLDANKTYVLTFVFSKDYEVNIKVYPTEVLPLFEKDSVNKNQHIYGWVSEERKWAKVSAVKCEDGSYAIAVKNVK